MRFVAYGRMSTDKQNPLSADDQVFEIRRVGEEKGWIFVGAYTDEAVSGFSVHGRDQYAQMQRDAEEKKFDCIVVEDLDRLGRNLGDLAKFNELMQYFGVAIYSLSRSSFISDLDIGFKGTMSAQFLKDLSQKTKRGLAANIRNGKSAGGISYGYERTAEVGVHKINKEEAAIILRIYKMYADGHTPRSIAGTLNAEGIPGPRGGVWNASTINGHRQRKNGILRNHLYIGIRLWGRTEKVKSPIDGKTQIRLKTEEELQYEVPELRIVEQELWDRVQSLLPNRENAKYRKRADNLLSGKMKCGVCGSSYISNGGGKHLKFGCGGRRERSDCTNRRMIARNIIDNSVLYAISQHLLDGEHVQEAIKSYNGELATHLKSLNTAAPKLKKRLKQISEARMKLLVLLERGIEPSAIEARLLELDAEERLKKNQLENAPKPLEVDPTEALASYREVVQGIMKCTLEDNYAYKREVMTAVRELVDEVVIYPRDDEEGRDVELVGDIEGLFVGDTDRHGGEMMVLGGGIEPPTRGFSISLVIRTRRLRNAQPVT